MTTEGSDITAALTRLAKDDVAALLDDIRRDGAQLARRRLTEAYADALVRAVARLHELAPPPTPTGSVGCYVYAVVAGGGIGAGGVVPGVQPGGPVEVITVGDISAVVSEVDVEAMRAGAAAELDEDGWLAAAVRAHERVVLSAFRSAPTVPMRFGIVHPGRQDVAALLADHADSFRAELRRVEGRGEWSVKVLADAEVVAERVREANGPVQSPPVGDAGCAYLLRERSRRSLVDRSRDFVASRLDQVAAELAAAAQETAVKSVSHDPGDRPVLHAAYLVPRCDEGRFASLVEQLAARGGPDGFTVELTGPWPPYHFTTLRLEASHD